MLDVFAKILGSVMSQMNPGGDKLGKIEKDLARKFEAMEAQARRESAKRWFFLLLVCALLALGAWIGYGQAKKEVKSMIGERLDKEFSSVYLQQTIEESAKKYTELNLKAYVDGQLASHYRVGKLEAMARQDSRKAYEDLVVLANDPDYKGEAEFSLSVVRKRYASLVYPFESQSAGSAPEGATIQMKLEPAHSGDLQVDALRPRLIHLAQESKKNYIVPDFIRFLKESDSLGASVGVCRILSHNYGEKAGDFEFDKWTQFLETLDQNAVKISGK